MTDLYEYSTPELVRGLGTRFKHFRPVATKSRFDCREQNGGKGRDGQGGSVFN